MNETIWSKKELWSNIYSIILEKKTLFFEKKRQAESSFNFNKILKDFLKNTKNISEFQISEKDKKIMALDELNFLMINVNLKSEIAIDFLIDIAQTYIYLFIHITSLRNNLDYNNIVKLLEKQENKRFSDIQKNFEESKHSTPKNKFKVYKFQKDLDEYKDLYPIKKALCYLSLQDKPINLLMINKRWKSFLKNKIAKMYLMKFSNKNILTHKRVDMWMSFLIDEVCS